MPCQIEIHCTLGGKSSYVLLTPYDSVETLDRSIRRAFNLPSSATLTYYNQRNIVESDGQGQLVGAVISDVALVGSTLAYLDTDNDSKLLLPLVDDPQRGQVLAVQVQAENCCQLQEQGSSGKSKASSNGAGKKSREQGKQPVQEWAAEVDKLCIHNAARNKDGLYLQLSDLNKPEVPKGECNGPWDQQRAVLGGCADLFPGSMQLSGPSQPPRSRT